MNSDVGDSHLPESLYGTCGCFRYHGHKVTKSQSHKMAKYENSFTTAIHTQTSYRHDINC